METMMDQPIELLDEELDVVAGGCGEPCGHPEPSCGCGGGGIAIGIGIAVGVGIVL